MPTIARRSRSPATADRRHARSPRDGRPAVLVLLYPDATGDGAGRPHRAGDARRPPQRRGQLPGRQGRAATTSTSSRPRCARPTEEVAPRCGRRPACASSAARAVLDPGQRLRGHAGRGGRRPGARAGDRGPARGRPDRRGAARAFLPDAPIEIVERTIGDWPIRYGALRRRRPVRVGRDGPDPQPARGGRWRSDAADPARAGGAGVRMALPRPRSLPDLGAGLDAARPARPRRAATAGSTRPGSGRAAMPSRMPRTSRRRRRRTRRRTRASAECSVQAAVDARRPARRPPRPPRSGSRSSPTPTQPPPSITTNQVVFGFECGSIRAPRANASSEIRPRASQWITWPVTPLVTRAGPPAAGVPTPNRRISIGIGGSRSRSAAAALRAASAATPPDRGLGVGELRLRVVALRARAAARTPRGSAGSAGTGSRPASPSR